MENRTQLQLFKLNLIKLSVVIHHYNGILTLHIHMMNHYNHLFSH
jgi:hypothetical protein